MRAMILAAGLGTRLRPLTDRCPKALVDVGGRTLLEITIERLRSFGVREFIVNVHHLADMVVSRIEALTAANPALRIEVSREEVILDTGGGLRKAAGFFLEDPARLDEPFFLHNVDVISSIDLGAMLRWHEDRRALATLAVLERTSRRPLLFDEEGVLAGHRSGDQIRLARETPNPRELEFTGIHVISPRTLPLLDTAVSPAPEAGQPFSIIPAYLGLARAGHRIVAFPADAYDWCDVGNHESLERARETFASRS